MVTDALNRKSRGVLFTMASWDWQMLEAIGRFRLHYKGQAQGTLGSLVAKPSLLSRVIEFQEGHRDIVHQGLGMVRYR